MKDFKNFNWHRLYKDVFNNHFGVSLIEYKRRSLLAFHYVEMDRPKKKLPLCYKRYIVINLFFIEFSFQVGTFYGNPLWIRWVEFYVWRNRNNNVF